MVAAQNDKFDGELFDAYQMCIVLNCCYYCNLLLLLLMS